MEPNTEELLKKFREKKEQLCVTAETVLAEINSKHLPIGDSVSYSTICNWLSGRVHNISHKNAQAIEGWLQSTTPNTK